MIEVSLLRAEASVMIFQVALGLAAKERYQNWQEVIGDSEDKEFAMPIDESEVMEIDISVLCDNFERCPRIPEWSLDAVYEYPTNFRFGLSGNEDLSKIHCHLSCFTSL